MVPWQAVCVGAWLPLTRLPSLVAAPNHRTRTPLTTIPIHSGDRRKPPFCYTVERRNGRSGSRRGRFVRTAAGRAADADVLCWRVGLSTCNFRGYALPLRLPVIESWRASLLTHVCQLQPRLPLCLTQVITAVCAQRNYTNLAFCNIAKVGLH